MRTKRGSPRHTSDADTIDLDEIYTTLAAAIEEPWVSEERTRIEAARLAKIAWLHALGLSTRQELPRSLVRTFARIDTGWRYAA